MPNPTQDQFDRELAAARDRSVTTLRQAADHRRVEHLARQIHATLQGESQANSCLALTQTLGHWLRSMPPNEQITTIAVIVSLIGQELGPPDRTESLD